MHALLVAALLFGTTEGDGMKLAVEAGGRLTVIMESLPPAAKENGADEAAMRTQVEAALRRCGMPVAEGVDTSFFGVDLVALSVKGGFAAYLRSTVRRVERVKERFAVVQVWSSGILLVGPPGALGGRVRESLADQLDEFCNEYLKAKQSLSESRKQ